MTSRTLRHILITPLVILLFLIPFCTAALPAAAHRKTTAKASTFYEVAKVTENWRMWDGVKLPVSVFYPNKAGAGKLFPGIIVVHGWSIDKSMSEDAARYYARRGYVTLAFTARGWFGAGGEVGCMDPEHEMKDVSCIIDLLEKDKRLPLLTDSKGAVVGITGASMGGCFSYLKAPRKDPRPGDPGDARIRAVVPMHGSFDLLYSLYPNGVLKFFWPTMLLASSYTGNFSGLLMNVMYIAADQESNAWQKMYALVDALTKMTSLFTKVSNNLPYIYSIAMGRRISEQDYAKQWLKVRSARYWCDEEYDGVVEHPMTAPILILAGWNDDLFNPNEGLMAYQYTEGPKRIIISNHGHLGCFPGPYPVKSMGSPEGPWLMEQVDMWFDRFLKGVKNGVDTGPPVAFYKGGAPTNFAQAASYPMPGTGQVSYYMGRKKNGSPGTLGTAKPAASSGSDLLVNIGLTGSISLFYFQDAPQLLGGQTMNVPRRIDLGKIPLTETGFTSPVLQQDMTIMGVPRFEAFYRSSSDFTQLIPWLYEVTPDGRETLVTRGCFEGYNEKPGALTGTDGPVEMQACYHRFSAGSRIRLKVGTADLITCWPHWALDSIHLQRRADAASRVILPVVPNLN